MDINKVYITLIALLSWSMTVTAQMMKPSVMVVPSDRWCQEHGFMVDNGNVTYPDYKAAIVNDDDLLNVISKINIIMADRGFPLENLETALKNLKTEDVERSLYTAKDGSAIEVNGLDELYRAATADIILQLTWDVNKTGPKSSITFNLQALDSYTTKQVAGAQGTGRASFASDISQMLEEAVVSHTDDFCSRLIQHFVDISENGREISMDVCLSQGADFDFTAEYDDYELTEIITGLVAKEAYNGRFSVASSTESLLQYRSVRIPVRDPNGLPMDAYSFGRRIARALRKPPYEIDTKVIAKGLGKAVLILGN